MQLPAKNLKCICHKNTYPLRADIFRATAKAGTAHQDIHQPLHP